MRWPQVESYLELILAADPPPSLRAVIRPTGRDRQALREHFPDRYEALGTRHAQWAASQAAERYASLAAELTDIVSSLRDEGVYASRRQLEARFSASLREPQLGQLWRSLQAGSS